jgi:hypothetical protein
VAPWWRETCAQFQALGSCSEAAAHALGVDLALAAQPVRRAVHERLLRRVEDGRAAGRRALERKPSPPGGTLAPAPRLTTRFLGACRARGEALSHGGYTAAPSPAIACAAPPPTRPPHPHPHLAPARTLAPRAPTVLPHPSPCPPPTIPQPPHHGAWLAKPKPKPKPTPKPSPNPHPHPHPITLTLPLT